MTPEFLRMIRKVDDLSKRQMAYRLGLSVSLIKKIERGERNVSRRTENKVKEAFEPAKIEKVKELLNYGNRQITKGKGMEDHPSEG